MVKATNFKFCTNIHRIDRNKSPLKILRKVDVGVLGDSRNFQGIHTGILGASRSHLCDSWAFLFFSAGIKESCTSNGNWSEMAWLGPAERVVRWATTYWQSNWWNWMAEVFWYCLLITGRGLSFYVLLHVCCKSKLMGMEFSYLLSECYRISYSFLVDRHDWWTWSDDKYAAWE